MTFLNLSLLFAALLAIIPIVLHLVMRQQPRRVIFPTVQLLQRRRESNQRRLQVRQWLLLALRCAAIGLLALAFARPSVPAGLQGSFLVAGLLLILLLVSSLALVLTIVQRRGKIWIGASAFVTSLLLIGSLLAWSLARTGEAREPIASRHQPVAAALVIDTSVSMDYEFENRTRLAQAQQLADRLLRSFPAESRIAVVETRPAPLTFAVDSAAAQRALERLKTSGISEPWSDTLSRTLGLLQANTLTRREIYLFTDLTRSSFTISSDKLRNELAQVADVALYVIDVGVPEPHNVALSELALSQESLSVGGTLQLDTEVSAIGSPGPRTAELWLEKPDPERPVLVDDKLLIPEEVRRDSQPLILQPLTTPNAQPSTGQALRDTTSTRSSSSSGSDTRSETTAINDASPDNTQRMSGEGIGRASSATSSVQRLRFALGGLTPGQYHGRVKLTGTDSLPADDQRFFSLEVRSAWSVLVVAPPAAYAPFLTEALAPFELREIGANAFTTEVIEPTQLASQTLARFTAIALLDPPPLTISLWEQLADYVRTGGSLVIALGQQATTSGTFAHPTAQQLMGGKLDRVWRSSGRELFLAPQSYDHPILAPFRDQTTSVPWNWSPIYRHWGLTDLQEQTRVVIRYTNGQPALLDVTYGRGQVLTLTTPISDPLQPAGRTAWNELPTSEVSWPYFVLINEMFRFLAGEGRNRLNYLTGEMVSLQNDAERLPERYQLFAPDEPPLEVAASDGALVIRSTESPGHYRLRGFRERAVLRGFSVNLPSQESDLSRLTRNDLDQLLGPQRYQFARNAEEIETEVDASRLGSEFYPYLLVLLAVVCGLEMLLANRFYSPAATPGRT